MIRLVLYDSYGRTDFGASFDTVESAERQAGLSNGLLDDQASEGMWQVVKDGQIC